MKKLQIEISDRAHDQLLKIQLDRKIRKEERTTIVHIATDVLEKCLIEEKSTKPQEA